MLAPRSGRMPRIIAAPGADFGADLAVAQVAIAGDADQRPSAAAGEDATTTVGVMSSPNTTRSERHRSVPNQSVNRCSRLAMHDHRIDGLRPCSCRPFKTTRSE